MDIPRRGRRLVGVKVTSGPAEEPITGILTPVLSLLEYRDADLENWQRQFLTQLLKTAVNRAENRYGLAFITQTVRATYQGPLPRTVRLPRRPGTALTTVEIKESSSWATKTLSDYAIETESRVARDDMGAPLYDGTGLFRVTYTAGLSSNAAGFTDAEYGDAIYGLTKMIVDMQTFKTSVKVGTFAAVDLPGKPEEIFTTFIEGRGWNG